MGGKLQGVEAAYLSRQAGWKAVLVDRNRDAPAAGMCDNFIQADLMEKDKLVDLFKKVKLVIPAVENSEVLENIKECALAAGVKIIYDSAAYALSSSKIESDKLFARLDLPVPKPWSGCGFPVVIKPSGASGSENVYKINSLRDFNELTLKLGNLDSWVKQEYLRGPSYSIEVIGCKGDYQTFQITELEMDAAHDCKRVLAPAQLSTEKQDEFKSQAVKIARALNLNGIMDVEVILHDEKFKVLEIDARLPSQTPTVVYKATGINMLEVLWSGGLKRREKQEIGMTRGVVYEHIKVRSNRLIEVGGEHIMAGAGRLHILKKFFGADEAISNYDRDKTEWVATLIITGKNRQEAWLKRTAVINNIMQEFAVEDCMDTGISNKE
jgi:pyrrolysine biosynthesis protein PylC